MAKVLIVGGGAREHALGLGLLSKEQNHTLLFAPGNAGTLALGRNEPVASSDVAGLVALAVREQVDLVVIGPEAPLVFGLADALGAVNIAAFGPSRRAAQLEGSKAFMKRLCARAGIPTAPFAIFDQAEPAKAHVRALGRPLVVKADGLCAGKGVVVPLTIEECCDAIDRMLVHGELGEAGRTIVLEERLTGEEASFHVICDGKAAVPLLAAQDHKRVFDGDLGPNTGGMGAYAPAPVVTPEVRDEVMDAIVEPTLRAMAELGAPFRGVLFVGLMIEAGRPSVLEFNVRFGDPEATVVLPMLSGDLFVLLDGAARGTLDPMHASSRSGAALSVVMAAEHYPATPATGDRIEGLDQPHGEDVCVFHAGTRREGNAVVTAGGRVLTVGARGASLVEARARAYDAVEHLSFRGAHYRRDIGARALKASELRVG
jgi:phosphoribosylamine--glycine ligase